MAATNYGFRRANRTPVQVVEDLMTICQHVETWGFQVLDMRVTAASAGVQTNDPLPFTNQELTEHLGFQLQLIP